mgnify:FL=1
MNKCKIEKITKQYIEPNYYFKFQPIVCKDNNNIGYEVLLDFNRFENIYLGSRESYINAITFGNPFEAFLLEIPKLLSQKNKVKWELENKHLFFNLERHKLCNQKFIHNVIDSSKQLYEENISLVVEITERNLCNDCPVILAGLKQLIYKDVILAVDDFDIYKGDFRQNEFEYGYYQFAKIEAPKNNDEQKIARNFIDKCRVNNIQVIIERVEKEADLVPDAFGYQGFMIDKGESWIT